MKRHDLERLLEGPYRRDSVPIGWLLALVGIGGMVWGLMSLMVH